jgi:hypothetical protein
MQYVIARAKEASTWRGVMFVMTALGVTLSPDQQEAIVGAGLAMAGLVGVFFPDKK